MFFCHRHRVPYELQIAPGCKQNFPASNSGTRAMLTSNRTYRLYDLFSQRARAQQDDIVCFDLRTRSDSCVRSLLRPPSSPATDKPCTRVNTTLRSKFNNRKSCTPAPKKSRGHKNPREQRSSIEAAKWAVQQHWPGEVVPPCCQ